MTKQQQHILSLVRDGWTLYKRAGRLRTQTGTAWLERGAGSTREVRHTTPHMVAMLLKAGVITPTMHVQETATTAYDIAERVDAPHSVV